jgi:hypothetical protein
METATLEAPAATETAGVVIPQTIQDACASLEKARAAFWRRIDNTPPESQPVNREWLADDGMVAALDRLTASAARQVDEEGAAPRGCGKLYAALETFSRAWLAFCEAADGYGRLRRTAFTVPSNVWQAVDAIGAVIAELSRPVVRRKIERLEELKLQGLNLHQMQQIYRGLTHNDIRIVLDGGDFPEGYVTPEEAQYRDALEQRNAKHDATGLTAIAGMIHALRRKESAEN